MYRQLYNETQKTQIKNTESTQKTRKTHYSKALKRRRPTDVRDRLETETSFLHYITYYIT